MRSFLRQENPAEALASTGFLKLYGAADRTRTAPTHNERTLKSRPELIQSVPHLHGAEGGTRTEGKMRCGSSCRSVPISFDL